MGMLRDLGRRVAGRLASRVGKDDLFEKVGERPRVAPPAPPPPARGYGERLGASAPAAAPTAAAPPAPAAAPAAPSLVPTANGQAITPAEESGALCISSGTEAVVRACRPKGRPVIIHHWATWCEPCEIEIPEVEALYQRIKHKADLVGVSWDLFQEEEDPGAATDRVEAWAKAHGVTWRTHVVTSAQPEDFFERMKMDFHQIPQTRVVGADGKILGEIHGPMGIDELDRLEGWLK